MLSFLEVPTVNTSACRMENRMASALDGEAGYIPLCDLSELRPRRYFYREVSIKIEEQSYHILWFSVQSH